MDCLYHYCANEKFYSILQNQNIRMGDISKSNDSLELQLFFPELHRTIYQKYAENPFPFRLGELRDLDAMRELLQTSEKIWYDRFNSGDYSNFVICFSEVKDCLSQWRGYADDGRGGCIGFSLDVLRQYCDASNGVLRLEKVEYADKQMLWEILSGYVDFILSSLVNYRQWIVENITKDDSSPDTDHLLRYEFDGMASSAFANSLRYKTFPFHEEQEWRVFLATEGFKRAEWVIDKKEPFYGPQHFDDTLNFLNNRIDFRYTNNDLVPFCPLHFSEFPQNPVTEVWLGPKNNARPSDVHLFLHKYGYQNVAVYHSSITYR